MVELGGKAVVTIVASKAVVTEVKSVLFHVLEVKVQVAFQALLLVKTGESFLVAV